MKLNEKLATIQTKFKSKKSRFNSFGKYNFRSAEDILEATKPFLLELGVSVTINEDIQEIGGLLVMTSTADLYDGKDSISARAMVGVDLNQKGIEVAAIIDIRKKEEHQEIAKKNTQIPIYSEDQIIKVHGMSIDWMQFLIQIV